MLFQLSLFAARTVRRYRAYGVLTAVAAVSCARVQPVTIVTAAATAPTAAPPVEPPLADTSRPSLNGNAVVALQALPPKADSEVVRAVDSVRRDADTIAAAVALPELPTWDIDVHSYETRTQVAHYLTRFTGSSREYIASRLSEGTRFEPMIREALRNGGIPEDMYYLALVESGYDPNAYSRAAAVGMWQFMSSTARGMGLRVDWWVDERRDPVRSTRAAVEFIRGLRDQFGSIYLAAAAYNGGPGRIARGLTRYADDLDGTAGDDLFFALADKNYLKNETREYVPQIIAAALIAKDPSRYGLTIETRPVFAYDSAAVPALTSLAVVAKSAGTTVAELRRLNPQILRGVTPPKATTTLRIPSGTAARFDSVFAGIPDSVRRGARLVVTTGKETPEKLAKLTGVSARQIGLFNTGLKKKESGAYRAEQVIYVPKPEAVAAATSVPDPSIERWGTSSSSGSHIVKKGETLGLIAKHYQTTTADLMRINRLKKSIIFPGQEILISAPTKASSSKR